MSQNEELISRILDLHIPVVIMSINCEENNVEPEPVEELMLDHPGSHTQHRHLNVKLSHIKNQLNALLEEGTQQLPVLFIFVYNF